MNHAMITLFWIGGFSVLSYVLWFIWHLSDTPQTEEDICDRAP